MQSGYEFTRNEYGVVLRKTIDTILLLKNKKEGRCYIQWRSLGYESLGGNGFDTEVGAWIKQERIGFGYSRVSLNFPGNRKIIAGIDYEAGEWHWDECYLRCDDIFFRCWKVESVEPLVVFRESVFFRGWGLLPDLPEHEPAVDYAGG